jgi:hypothetical protein
MRAGSITDIHRQPQAYASWPRMAAKAEIWRPSNAFWPGRACYGKMKMPECIYSVTHYLTQANTKETTQRRKKSCDSRPMILPGVRRNRALAQPEPDPNRSAV